MHLHDFLKPTSPIISIMGNDQYTAIKNSISTCMPQNSRIVTIKGHLCRSKSSLLNEFYGNLCFPEYFGFNWDALSDCLTDFAWFEPFNGLTLVMERFDDLSLGKKELSTFLEIFEGAGTEWTKLCKEDEVPRDEFYRERNPILFKGIFLSKPENVTRCLERVNSNTRFGCTTIHQ